MIRAVQKRSSSMAHLARVLRSRTASLASIIEVDETGDEELSDDASGSQLTSEATVPASRLDFLSSPGTTPGCADSDVVYSPHVERDYFSMTLYRALQLLVTGTTYSTSMSTISSDISFSPRSGDTSTPHRSATRKRSASSSLDSRTRSLKKARTDGFSGSTDDAMFDRTPIFTVAETSAQSTRFGATRPASIRRGDSLKADSSWWIPTAPSTPPDFTIPTIAPYIDSIASHPLNARSRLSAYILRERDWRDNFCLDRLTGDLDAWEASLGLGRAVRKQVMRWVLDVRPGKYWPMDCDDCDCDCEQDDVIDDPYLAALDDQLAAPETHFHAAYLFLLFNFKSRGGIWNIWDMALACIAVGAKFHRDFLPPMLPLYTFDLLRLAPHTIGQRELEKAQRTLLAALGYSIGGTSLPGGVLDEIWEAVPGARDTFSVAEWDLVLAETWRILLVVVVEPDVLQFPLSLLTAAAVVDASLTVLTWRTGIADVDDLEGMIADLEAVLQLRTVDMDQCRGWLINVIESTEGRDV